MTKKLICLDVDGTILDFDRHMSPRVRSAIRHVIDAGHEVVIATGRSMNATLPVIRTIGQSSGYTVCSNGGVTLELTENAELGYRVARAQHFSPAEVLEQIRHRLPSAKYAIEIANGEFLSTERFQDFSFGVEAKGVSFEELKEATAVRLVVFSQGVDTDKFAEAVEAIGLQGVSYTVGYNSWLDVAATGITKASGLETLRSHLGIDLSDTIAVGDGYNDVEMLAWAGRGIAMGQAPDGVKAIADEITMPITEDGLVEVLEPLTGR